MCLAAMIRRGPQPSSSCLAGEAAVRCDTLRPATWSCCPAVQLLSSVTSRCQLPSCDMSRDALVLRAANCKLSQTACAIGARLNAHKVTVDVPCCPCCGYAPDVASPSVSHVVCPGLHRPGDHDELQRAVLYCGVLQLVARCSAPHPRIVAACELRSAAIQRAAP